MPKGIYVRPSFEERFFSRIVLDGDCWIYKMPLDRDGYGKIKRHKRNIRAHRAGLLIFFGEGYNQPGLVADHLCRRRDCVNPFHIEMVTPAENVRRGIGLCAINAVKTECQNGHPFDEDNTYVDPRGSRVCKKCRNKSLRRYRKTCIYVNRKWVKK